MAVSTEQMPSSYGLTFEPKHGPMAVENVSTQKEPEIRTRLGNAVPSSMIAPLRENDHGYACGRNETKI